MKNSDAVTRRSAREAELHNRPLEFGRLQACDDGCQSRPQDVVGLWLLLEIHRSLSGDGLDSVRGRRRQPRKTTPPPRPKQSSAAVRFA